MTIVVHPLIYHLIIYPILLCIAIAPFIAISEWIIHKFKIRYKEIPKILSYIMAFLACFFIFNLYETYYPSKDYELYITSKNKTVEVKRDGLYLLTTDKEIIGVSFSLQDTVLDYEVVLEDETIAKVLLFYSFYERNPVKLRSYHSNYYKNEEEWMFIHLDSYFNKLLKEDVEMILQKRFSNKNMEEIDDAFIEKLEEEILLIAKNKLDSKKIQIKLSINNPS